MPWLVNNFAPPPEGIIGSNASTGVKNYYVVFKGTYDGSAFNVYSTDDKAIKVYTSTGNDPSGWVENEIEAYEHGQEYQHINKAFEWDIGGIDEWSNMSLSIQTTPTETGVVATGNVEFKFNSLYADTYLLVDKFNNLIF